MVQIWKFLVPHFQFVGCKKYFSAFNNLVMIIHRQVITFYQGPFSFSTLQIHGKVGGFFFSVKPFSISGDEKIIFRFWQLCNDSSFIQVVKTETILRTFKFFNPTDLWKDPKVKYLLHIFSLLAERSFLALDNYVMIIHLDKP